MAEAPPDEQSVFLNVPYDLGYERNFVALIAALVSIGRKPRCVLEITEDGQGRLSRIIKHLKTCRTSIHDLSRAGVPVRFNLPFELGLAFAISASGRAHSIVILEKEEGRLDRTLSDIKGRDILIHEGKPGILISRVFSALGNIGKNPRPPAVYDLWQELWRYADWLKSRQGHKDLFDRWVFLELVAAATDLAREAGFIAP